MLAMSHAERDAMGLAARRSFETRFDLETNALSLLDVIESASPEKAGGGRASDSSAAKQ